MQFPEKGVPGGPRTTAVLHIHVLASGLGEGTAGGGNVEKESW